MTPSQVTAESLLWSYLSGRSMPKILWDAVVWAIEVRPAKNTAHVITLFALSSLWMVRKKRIAMLGQMRLHTA